MKRAALQIAIILSICALVVAQTSTPSGNAPAPPPSSPTPMIAPQGWVPQNPPGPQPNANSQAASVKATQKKSSAAKPHAQAAKPAHPAAPKN